MASTEKMASVAGAVSAANPLAEQVYQKLKNDIFNFRLFPGGSFFRKRHCAALRRVAYAHARWLVSPAARRLSRSGIPTRLEGIAHQFRAARPTLRLAHRAGGGNRLNGLQAAQRRISAIDALKAFWCVAPELRESDPITMFEMDENFHRRQGGGNG